MYSKIVLNSKFMFSRKCQNKSVCVRRFLRCSDAEHHLTKLTMYTFQMFNSDHGQSVLGLHCSKVYKIISYHSLKIIGYHASMHAA